MPRLMSSCFNLFIIDETYFIRFIVFISYFTQSIDIEIVMTCGERHNQVLFYMNKSVTRGTTLIFKRVEIYTTNVDFI